jgi:hypothetical protein
VTLLSEAAGDAGSGRPGTPRALPGDGRPGTAVRREAIRRREEARRLLGEADQLDRTAEGQERTASALAWLPPAWTTVHDLAMPGSQVAIDHLAVGPTGVFAVATRVHVGTVRYGNGTLWCDRRPMRRELQALAFEATRLGAVLDTPVVPLVCFALGELPRRELTLDGVRVLPLGALLNAVTDRETTLRAEECERVSQEAVRLTRAGRPLVVPRRAVAAADDDAPATGSPADDGAIDAPAAPSTDRRLRPALRTAAAMVAVGVAAYGLGSWLRGRGDREGAVHTIDATSLVRTPGPTLVTGLATDTDLPAITADARCPAIDRGWDLTPRWPAGAAAAPAAVAYELAWRAAGAASWTAAPRAWTSAADAAPLVIAGLAADAAVEVRLTALDRDGRPLTDGVTLLHAPAARC